LFWFIFVSVFLCKSNLVSNGSWGADWTHPFKIVNMLLLLELGWNYADHVSCIYDFSGYLEPIKVIESWKLWRKSALKMVTSKCNYRTVKTLLLHLRPYWRGLVLSIPHLVWNHLFVFDCCLQSAVMWNQWKAFLRHFLFCYCLH